MRKQQLVPVLLLVSLAGVTAPLAHAQTDAQQPRISPPENIVTDNVPPIPASLTETAGRYLDYRTAFDADWHPQRREMLISTRFGDTFQLHLVKMPGGARQQLTFFSDPVRTGRFHPTRGDYIVFQKDVGGGEWYQLYRPVTARWSQMASREIF